METRWQKKTDEFKAVAQDKSIYKIMEYTTMREFDSFGIPEITEGLKVYRTDKSEHVHVNEDGSYTILTDSKPIIVKRLGEI